MPKHHIFFKMLERFGKGKHTHTHTQNPTDAGSYDLRNITNLQTAKSEEKSENHQNTTTKKPSQHINKEKNKNKNLS